MVLHGQVMGPGATDSPSVEEQREPQPVELVRDVRIEER